jgi:hypothetical protein
MKKNLLKILLFGLIVSFTGCYTVLWTPDETYPTAQDNADNSYYQNPYFGDYYYYYDYPWWLEVTPPAKYENGSVPYVRDTNANVEDVRNNIGERGNAPRTPIINTPPPSRNINTTPTTTPTNNNNGNVQSANKSNTGNKSSNDSSNSRSNNSSKKSNPVRNDNGGRNTNGDGRN